MAEKPLMKDGINKDAIERIATALLSVYPGFAARDFQKDCLHQLDTLELKQRIHHIISVLAKYLPDDFTQTAPLLIATKAHWNYGNPDDALRGFAAWPLIDYVGVHGLGHPQLSLDTLKELTSLFSAEFAIQPFMTQHFDITYSYLMKWCEHEDEHIRRLVSEGSRPRLPWGLRLQQFCEDPTPLIPLLEKLKNDQSEYVRRSVANNLNDISKDHPELVISTCKRWQQDASKETQWVIKHATRTLVKAGHPDVFSLLGFTRKPKVSIQSFKADKKVSLGEVLDFGFSLTSMSKKSQKLVIDYAIHHAKANGKTSAKVFKLKTLSLPAGDSITLNKKHPFKQITTRKYYSGKHSVEILINGTPYKKADFMLEV